MYYQYFIIMYLPKVEVQTKFVLSFCLSINNAWPSNGSSPLGRQPNGWQQYMNIFSDHDLRILFIFPLYFQQCDLNQWSSLETLDYRSVLQIKYYSTAERGRKLICSILLENPYPTKYTAIFRSYTSLRQSAILMKAFLDMIMLAC